MTSPSFRSAQAGSRTPVIVVGAGAGGLAAAALLARRGQDVLVLERAEAPGGKLRELAVGPRRLDAGPTVFTLRWVFEQLFDDAGSSLQQHLALQPLEVLARHSWGDGPVFDLHADIGRAAEAIAELAGVAEGQRYRNFCARARAVYQTLEQPFLQGSRPNPVTLAARIGWGQWQALLGLSPFTTLWQALGEHFHDPRLRQLFGRYATYCGSSPFQAPATLMLVAHVEREGVWQVQGGMHRVAQALARLAGSAGAEVRYGCDVAEILVAGGRACGVRLQGGETLAASAVVFNGDSGALGRGLLGAAAGRAGPVVAPARRSLSAITWHTVARTSGFPLHHHNVFFAPDSPREFGELLRQRSVPGQPTVYLCAQDRGSRESGAQDPMPGEERLMCLVNAPADGDRRPIGEEELARCETAMRQTLARSGLVIHPGGPPMRATTPSDFERLFPGTGGALYGPASHGWRASFTRPGSRSRLPGLYLAGGSTHPGPGLPMAVLSGRLAAQSLLQDLARSSVRTSPRAAMPGGISTP